MVTIKDLGDRVQLNILLDVQDKKLGNTYQGDGFNFKDLKSYGFSVIVSRKTFVEFMEDITRAHTEMEQARAREIENELVQSFIENDVDGEEQIV